MKIPLINQNLVANLTNSINQIDNSNVVARGGFASLMKGSIADVSKSLKNSDKASNLSALNEIDLSDLVVTMNEAELKLKTMLTMRDSLVGMIQEIMRMQI